MPQFDSFLIFPQVFWLIFVFLIFYLITTFFFLPALFVIMKTRRFKKIICFDELKLLKINFVKNTSYYSYFFSHFTKLNIKTFIRILNKNFITILFNTSTTSKSIIIATFNLISTKISLYSFIKQIF